MQVGSRGGGGGGGCASRQRRCGMACWMDGIPTHQNVRQASGERLGARQRHRSSLGGGVGLRLAEVLDLDRRRRHIVGLSFPPEVDPAPRRHTHYRCAGGPPPCRGLQVFWFQHRLMAVLFLCSTAERAHVLCASSNSQSASGARWTPACCPWRPLSSSRPTREALAARLAPSARRTACPPRTPTMPLTRRLIRLFPCGRSRIGTTGHTMAGPAPHHRLLLHAPPPPDAHYCHSPHPTDTILCARAPPTTLPRCDRRAQFDLPCRVGRCRLYQNQCARRPPMPGGATDCLARAPLRPAR